MREIYLPFRQDMQIAIRDGAKCCTSRNKKHGNVGDRFRVMGEDYQLTGIYRLPLKQVSDKLYKDEGFETPEDFRNIWIEIHPRKGWDENQIVNVHYFEKVL